ncbi:fibronectin type III domain-containing protein [Paenibacillus periandrae]|uniref:fibronectin type III domain-containing protein n=1 Tax=Paenibacillus periandrae TaxID=1761741 RepID=UPI001F08CC56
MVDEAPINPPDTSAPSDPIVNVTGRTPNSITLSWTAATDNVGVTGYDVYNGNNKLVSLTANANLGYAVTGLYPNTTYILAVKARDAAGNMLSHRQLMFHYRTLTAYRAGLLALCRLRPPSG